MAKDKTLFSCSDCGGTSPKWLKTSRVRWLIERDPIAI
jgi:predicted ATP-dependent serine protease